MLAKISYTWELMGASWDVLKQDKALMVFPLLSGVCCLGVLISFAVPIITTDYYVPPDEGATLLQQIGYWGVVFLFYFVNYFIITFFNTAIIACAMARMAGGEPTITGGFNEAANRIHLILGWALLSATVGLALRMIEAYSDRIGQFVAGLIGMAWTVLTFLVVPVMVMENKGPVDALKESTSLLRKSWGEQLIGNFSFGILFALLSLPAVLVIGIGIYAAVALGSMAVAIAAVTLGVLYLILLALVQSALQSIFQAAVYMHAVGVPPAAGFSSQMLRDAMYQKQ